MNHSIYPKKLRLFKNKKSRCLSLELIRMLVCFSSRSVQVGIVYSVSFSSTYQLMPLLPFSWFDRTALDLITRLRTLGPTTPMNYRNELYSLLHRPSSRTTRLALSSTASKMGCDMLNAARSSLADVTSTALMTKILNHKLRLGFPRQSPRKSPASFLH